VNLTTLEEFVSHYRLKAAEAKEELVSIRSPIEPFDVIHTLKHPKLKLSHFGHIQAVVPDGDFDIDAIKHFLIDYSTLRDKKLVLYYRVTRYRKKEFGDGGKPVVFDVLNCIAPFIQRESAKAPGIEPFDLKLLHKPVEIKQKYLNGVNLYELKVNQEQVTEPYDLLFYSDVSWTERVFRAINMTWAFGVLRATSPDPVDCDNLSNEWFDSLGQVWEDADAIVSPAHGVPRAAITIFARNWFGNPNLVTSRYENTDLLGFLAQRELPILWSILKREDSSLSNDDLGFISDTAGVLFDLFSDCPNAVTLLAANIFEQKRMRLIWENTVKECEVCGRIFRFKQGKKYCSSLREGRDCGKRARNKRYYKTHREQLRDYYRKEMRVTRETYRRICNSGGDSSETDSL